MNVRDDQNNGTRLTCHERTAKSIRWIRTFEFSVRAKYNINSGGCSTSIFGASGRIILRRYQAGEEGEVDEAGEEEDA